MTHRSERYHAAMASPSRRQVLDTLLASPLPLDAAAVGERLGLHVTTARFHLDQLMQAGLVKRRSAAEQRRGRPRLLYRPMGTVRDDDARGQLIQVLAAALTRDGGHAPDAIEAGRHWGEAFETPDDPMPDLVDVLDRLGFQPQRSRDVDLIELRACPFRAAAREHPAVVCAVHQGLIEHLVEGSDVHAELIPFVEPDLCHVLLGRTQEGR